MEVCLKTNAFVLISLLMFSSIGFAETLVISGTVPDRGFTVLNNQNVNSQDNQKIKLNSKTELKVFTSNLNNFDSNSQKKWKKLSQNQILDVSSYVRVEAP